MAAGCTFLAFKKRITDRISQVAGRSIVLNMLNTQNDASPRSDCLSMHAHNRDRSAAAAIFADGTYFLDTLHTLIHLYALSEATLFHNTAFMHLQM
jgi:hypothetical protein